MRFLGLVIMVNFLIPGALNAQISINEIMATNSSTNIETDYYNFVDWVEIHNESASGVNLGNYYLTDDKNVLKKWRLPTTILSAGGYYIIYCDKKATGNHTNFCLSTEGETVYLVYNGQIKDFIKYGKQYPNVSYGKNLTDGQWHYCATPTPGSVNISSAALKPAPLVLFSEPAGRINSAKNITLAGNNVKYTIDGSEPESNSITYSTPLLVNQTRIIKARSFQDGYLPGEVNANSYFYQEHNFTLPVISVSYNSEYFWDYTIGIYIEGTNGVPGNCWKEANWNQTWEREAYFEYFDEAGVKQISQAVGVKVSGGCSRSFAEQKSLSVYARSKYGDKDLDYPFFKQKSEITKYKSLFLRNSGNDFNQTQLRDAFLQALFNESLDIDYQAYQPAIFYLNGQYFGIINIREKVNEDYLLTNYGYNNDSVDFLEGNLRDDYANSVRIFAGSSQDYQDLISFVNNNSLAENSNYEYVVSQLDLEEYINYMAVEIYIVNTDWPGNNLKYWKTSNDGKWRWVIFDTDFGFGVDPYNHETVDFATATDGPDWPNPPWSTLLFRKLMENGQFRQLFANKILTLRNSVFKPEWCRYVMDSLANVIDYEMTYHLNRFGGNKNNWHGKMDDLINYATGRYNFIPGYIKKYFGLSGEEVNINIDNQEKTKGKVSVNGSNIMYYPFTMRTYKDMPLIIKAIPEKGFVFKHWKYVDQYITENILDPGSEWKYLDEASDYPVVWKTLVYDDSSWNSGYAQLGYGDGDETTVISYGPDAGNKNSTVLFRRKFTVTDTTGIVELRFGVQFDDGVIIYLNEQEIIRDNMPDGDIPFNSFALTDTPNENAFSYFAINKDQLVIGDNIIACEVHQSSGTSSDLSFDLSIDYSYTIKAGGDIYGVNPVIISDTGFNISIEPVYEIIEKTKNIYLNELASVSGLFLDEWGERSGFVELYNDNDEAVALYGFFLSDDPDNLERYSIPDSTVIPANGFLTFYADGQQKQGVLHTPFKASENGEIMILSQKVGHTLTVIDSVDFDFLVNNYSYGKYVDGTGNWQYMVKMTPGAPNDPEEPIFPGVEAIALHHNINLYPNPSNGEITIFIDQNDFVQKNISVELTDISGKIVYPKIWLNNAISNLNLSYLNDGLYFARIFDGKQLVYTSKIIIIN